MACEACEHCHQQMSPDEEVAFREGYSYHKDCHKCYVCDETNLKNAEVFMGVIFCEPCALRIFQGCSTARRTKNSGRVRRTRKRDKRSSRRKIDKTFLNRIIELAGIIGCTSKPISRKSSDSLKTCCKSPVESKTTLQVKTEKSNSEHKKINSVEMGVTTDVTQELLEQINCYMTDGKSQPIETKNETSSPAINTTAKKQFEVHSKPDPRIAELGMSTEIANMPLRKKSGVPIIIQSQYQLKSKFYGGLNIDSDSSKEREDWGDSSYGSLSDSQRTRLLDRRLGSILRLPYRLFKRHILQRSSLISVISDRDGDVTDPQFRRFKDLFNEEIVQHQGRGLQRLYSTINKRKIPNKLGWLQFVPREMRIFKCPECSQVLSSTRCKHYKTSHSYRCMRTKVMQIAGPTKSELARFRNNLKRTVAPKAVRVFLSHKRHRRRIYPAKSAACGNDRLSLKSKSF